MRIRIGRFGNIPMLRNEGLRPIFHLVAVAVLCSGCDEMRPVIHAQIGMPVSDFNAQVAVREGHRLLDENDSDLWGSDAPHELVVKFKHGETRYLVGGGLTGGTMIHSSPMSWLDDSTDRPRLKTIAVTMSAEKLNAEEAIALAQERCRELKAATGIDAAYPEALSVASLDQLDVADGIAVCDLVGPREEFVVVISRSAISEIFEDPARRYIVRGSFAERVTRSG